MKKKIITFFFCSLFALLSFTALIFFGTSHIFSLKENVYKQKLLALQNHYESEINSLSENVSRSLKEEDFLSWLKNKLQTKPPPLEDIFTKKQRQNIEIVDYFLVNLVVLSPRGKVIYAFDALPLNETSFYKMSFIRPEMFFIENNNTLRLTLQTEYLLKANGQPLPPGYLLFFFDLRDLGRRIFSLEEKNFSPSKVLSYRYNFVYNETGRADLQTLLASVINHSFELASRWKRVYIKKENLAFQGYQLNNGIHFAYLYKANALGIPNVSLVGLFILGINLLCSFMLLIFFKDRQLFSAEDGDALQILRRLVSILKMPLLLFEKIFIDKARNKELKIPLKIYDKKTKGQEQEIISLLQSLEDKVLEEEVAAEEHSAQHSSEKSKKKEKIENEIKDEQEASEEQSVVSENNLVEQKNEQKVGEEQRVHKNNLAKVPLIPSAPPVAPFVAPPVAPFVASDDSSGNKPAKADISKHTNNKPVAMPENIFWKGTKVREVCNYLQKNKKLFGENSHFLSAITKLFIARGWLQESSGNNIINLNNGINFIAVLKKQRGKQQGKQREKQQDAKEPSVWKISEFSGVDEETTRRCRLTSNDALVFKYLKNGSPVFISKQKKTSLMLQAFLAPRDYNRLQGVLFFPLIVSRSKKRSEELAVGKVALREELELIFMLG